MGIDPIDDTLMMHPQLAGDPPKIYAIDVQPHGLLTHRVVIARCFGMGGIPSLTGLALVALTAAFGIARFDLLICILTVRTLSIHPSILPVSTPFDTPNEQLENGRQSNPEVQPKAERRRFSAEYKRRMVAEAEQRRVRSTRLC